MGLKTFYDSQQIIQMIIKGKRNVLSRYNFEYQLTYFSFSDDWWTDTGL